MVKRMLRLLGLSKKKEKGKTYKSDVGAKDLTAFIEG
jgi:hypothetical protein